MTNSTATVTAPAIDSSARKQVNKLVATATGNNKTTLIAIEELLSIADSYGYSNIKSFLSKNNFPLASEWNRSLINKTNAIKVLAKIGINATDLSSAKSVPMIVNAINGLGSPFSGNGNIVIDALHTLKQPTIKDVESTILHLKDTLSLKNKNNGTARLPEPSVPDNPKSDKADTLSGTDTVIKIVKSLNETLAALKITDQPADKLKTLKHELSELITIIETRF